MFVFDLFSNTNNLSLSIYTLHLLTLEVIWFQGEGSAYFHKNSHPVFCSESSDFWPQCYISKNSKIITFVYLDLILQMAIFSNSWEVSPRIRTAFVYFLTNNITMLIQYYSLQNQVKQYNFDHSARFYWKLSSFLKTFAWILL